jgi:hypothetical protein
MTAMRSDSPVIAPASALDPITARSLLGLAGLPTIVAIGPFDDQAHPEQLLRHGMGCRARVVARRYRLQRIALQPADQRNNHA